MKHFRFLFVITIIALILSGLNVTQVTAESTCCRVFMPGVMNNSVGAGSSLVTTTSPLPTLDSFKQSVVNNQPGIVRGVYVSDTLANPVVQQPANNYGYISSDPNAITQYGLAATQGVTGLIAHNNMAGKTFSQLTTGQKVNVIFGDGGVREYTVKTILKFQALNPYSPTSNFVDLITNQVLTAAELFVQTYMGGDHVTFQTCIEKNGNPAWGRLFIIAEP